MDDVDRANAQADQYLALCLRSATKERQPGPVPKGFCHYCEEPVPPAAIFCAQDDGGMSCAAEWQEEQRLLRMAGR